MNDPRRFPAAEPAKPAKDHGRETPRLDARQQRLAADFLNLARAEARPFKKRHPNLSDELDSAACFGLVKAAGKHDPAKGAGFATFARSFVRGALLDVVADAGRAGFRWLPEAGPGPLVLPLVEDPDGSTADPGADLAADEAFERLLAKVPGPHAAVCRRHFGRGLTMAEVAAELGISCAWASYLRKQALGFLAADLGGPADAA